MVDKHKALTTISSQTSDALSYFFSTNRDGGDLSVLLSSQISDQATGVITWHRTHQDWSAGLHLQPKECQQQDHTDDCKRFQRGKTVKVLVKYFYLILHNIGQVKRLLNDAHEGLSQHLCNKNVRHCKHTVWTEGLDQQQLVHCLANGS